MITNPHPNNMKIMRGNLHDMNLPFLIHQSSVESLKSQLPLEESHESLQVWPQISKIFLFGL